MGLGIWLFPPDAWVSGNRLRWSHSSECLSGLPSTASPGWSFGLFRIPQPTWTKT